MSRGSSSGRNPRGNNSNFGKPASSRSGQGGKSGAGGKSFGKTGGRPGSGPAKPYGKPADSKPYGKSAGAKSGGSKQAGGSAKRNTSAARKNSERAFSKERFGNSVPTNYARPTQRARAQARAESQAARAQYGELMDGVRLQKAMANAGVASRRVCEEMILEGRVEVNGNLVVELGTRIDPAKDSIHVDGMRIQLNKAARYYVFNKPKHVMCTMDDPEGRRTIADYFKNEHLSQRLFHVGRLDYKTEGLLILTNDGELANRLQHPKYEVPKTYLVQVPGPLPRSVGKQLRDGVKLEDGWIKVDDFKLIDQSPKHVMVEVTLHSGRNRIVRRMFDAVGHPVERLVRVAIGPIQLGDQKQGVIRSLGNQEVGHLMKMVGM